VARTSPPLEPRATREVGRRSRCKPGVNGVSIPVFIALVGFQRQFDGKMGCLSTFLTGKNGRAKIIRMAVNWPDLPNLASERDVSMATTRGIPEIVAALSSFVSASEPHLIRVLDPPLDLRRHANELQLLPALLDMGGCIGLRPDGEVVSFVWDEPYALRSERDPPIRNIAYYQASLKYPELVLLIPERPPDATICPFCDGSGKPLGIPKSELKNFTCYCGGLGWLPKQIASTDGSPLQ